MYIRIQQSGKDPDNRLVYILHGFRRPGEKNSRTMIIANLGKEKDLREEHGDNFDAWCQERVREEEMKRRFDPAIFQQIKDEVDTETNTSKIYYYGEEIYKKMWDKYRMGEFFDAKTSRFKKSKIPYSNLIFYLSALRILDPSSKLKTSKVLKDYYSAPDVDLHDIYRCMDGIYDLKDECCKYLNEQIKDRSFNVVFYDVTTFYFESVEADDLRNFGWGKDGKNNQVQVVLALMIDDQGIPITYELFPGNTSDFSTLEPFIDKLKAQYEIKQVMLVADRGLNSKSNLNVLLSRGIDYLMGYRLKNSGNAIKEEALNEKGYTYTSPEFKYKTIQLERKLPGGEIVNESLIITWSQKRANKDKVDRERLLEKTNKLLKKGRIKSDLKRSGKKFLKIQVESITVDEEAIANDEKYDGYYAIITSKQNIDEMFAIDAYGGLWKIEESFRIMKTTLEARPIFHWTVKRIQAHFLICYLGLFMQRVLEKEVKKAGLNMTLEEMISSIKQATLVSFSEKEGVFLVPATTNHYQDLCKLLKIRQKRVLFMNENK